MSDIPADKSNIAQDDVGSDIEESVGEDIDTSEIVHQDADKVHLGDNTDEIVHQDADTVHLGDNTELRFDELEPSTRYERHGYTYVTDEQGRPSMVHGYLVDQTGNRSAQQTEVGRLGNAFDEGGHLIAARFNGPTDGFNLVPQNANLNRGEWKAMENEWKKVLNSGGQVEVGIQPVYLDNTRRPAGFDVIYRTVDASGEKYVTKSFYNETNKEDSIDGN